MKIQALVAAVALAFAGTAFAAETTTTTTTQQSTTAQPEHPVASHMRSAKHKMKAKARHLRHRMHEQHARETTTTTMQHHMASRHMSTNHMGSAGAPDVDVNADGRRNRMDDAYSNWNKTHN